MVFAAGRRVPAGVPEPRAAPGALDADRHAVPAAAPRPGCQRRSLCSGRNASRRRAGARSRILPAGKDDPRVREAAALLSRAGFDVAVPTIPGLTRGRLGSEDVEPVVAALAARAEPSVVVAVSVGAGPALLAAADPRVRDRVRAVLSLGGYASASEVVRFWLTGAYGYDGLGGRVAHDPELVRMFVRANGDRPRSAITRPAGRRGPWGRIAPSCARRLPSFNATSTLSRRSGWPATSARASSWSTAARTVRCPTPRACGSRRRVRSGRRSCWSASWTT